MPLEKVARVSPPALSLPCLVSVESLAPREPSSHEPRPLELRALHAPSCERLLSAASPALSARETSAQLPVAVRVLLAAA